MLDTEQYDPHHPKRISDIAGNTETWKSLYTMIQDNTASHTVLVGPPGCGKSLFFRLALVGFPQLVIDCTANSGLRDVRDNIRIFARGSKQNDGRLRWIVFERADALTADTQAFLRRMLETTSASTRIAFECRDAGAISEPILSRSAIISVNQPENTEIVYELLRRTDFKVDRTTIEKKAHYTHGNMRSAVLNALSVWHNGISNVQAYDSIESLLAKRPSSYDIPADWVQWAIETESECRLLGLDLRDVLRIGWPKNHTVANTCAAWSRLGGTSPRALFFDCVGILARG
jgi:replication-associated recombination protein RarA